MASRHPAAEEQQQVQGLGPAFSKAEWSSLRQVLQVRRRRQEQVLQPRLQPRQEQLPPLDQALLPALPVPFYLMGRALSSKESSSQHPAAASVRQEEESPRYHRHLGPGPGAEWEPQAASARQVLWEHLAMEEWKPRQWEPSSAHRQEEAGLRQSELSTKYRQAEVWSRQSDQFSDSTVEPEQ